MLAQLLILLIALVLASGGIFVLLRARQTKGRWKSIRGIIPLMIGGGLLVLILPVMAGVAPNRPAGQATQSNQAVPSPTGQPADVILFATNTPHPAAVAMAQPAEVALLLTPLPTRYIYVTPLPTDLPVDTTECGGITLNNLNFRDGPGMTNTILTTIPHSSPLEIQAQNRGGTWLLTRYNGTVGWVSAEYVTLDESCSPIPVREDQG